MEIGEVVRFRVEDNNGVSALACSCGTSSSRNIGLQLQIGSSVIDVGECASEGTGTSISPDDQPTSKNDDFAFTVTEDITNLTPFATTIPEARTPTVSPTKISSIQGNEVQTSIIPEGSSGSNTPGQGLPSAPQQTSEATTSTAEGGSTSDEGSISAGENLTDPSNDGGRHASYPSQTVAPNNSYVNFDEVASA